MSEHHLNLMTDRKMKAAKAAFDTSVDNGITFFDTAEVYGSRVGKWFGFTRCFDSFDWLCMIC